MVERPIKCCKLMSMIQFNFFKFNFSTYQKKNLLIFHPENYMPEEIDLKHQNNALPLKFTVDCTVAPSGGLKSSLLNKVGFCIPQKSIFMLC